MAFNQALVMDLLGAPEFILGIFVAKHFEKHIPTWKLSVHSLLLAAAVFIATGLIGTTFRLLLFGSPSPGFISFGFGYAIISSQSSKANKEGKQTGA